MRRPVMHWLKFWNVDSLRREGNLPYTDPLQAGRHPFQTLLLALCFVSGLPQLFGQVTANSIEATLPPWLGIAWGFSLVLGSGISLFGSHVWVRRDYATALTLERIGLYLAGSAASVYALCIFALRGPSSLLSVGIILAFGLSCLRRGSDIGLIFERALHNGTAPEVDTEEGR